MIPLYFWASEQSSDDREAPRGLREESRLLAGLGVCTAYP